MGANEALVGLGYYSRRHRSAAEPGGVYKGLEDMSTEGDGADISFLFAPSPAIFYNSWPTGTIVLLTAKYRKSGPKL